MWIFRCDLSYDGNLAGNRTEDISYIHNVPGGIANGDFVAFKWIFNTTYNSTDSDDLAVDDLNFVLFDDDNTTWYMLSVDNDPALASSWTRWPNDLPSSVFPSCDDVALCSDADATFVIRDNQDLLYDIEFTGDDVTLEIAGTPDFDARTVELSGANAIVSSDISLDFGTGDLLLSGANSDVDISGDLDFTSGDFIQSGANSTCDIDGNVSFTSGRFISGGANSTLNVTGNVNFTSGSLQLNGDEIVANVNGDLGYTTGTFSSLAEDSDIDIDGNLSFTSGIVQFTGENANLEVSGTSTATNGGVFNLSGDSSSYVFNGAFDMQAGGSIFLQNNSNLLDFKEVVTLESTDLNVSGNKPMVFFRKSVSVSEDFFATINSTWSSTNGQFTFEDLFNISDAVGTLDLTGDSNIVSIAGSFTCLADVTISGETNAINITGASTITADDFTVSGNRNSLNFGGNITGSSTDFTFLGNQDSLVVDGNFSLTTGNYSIGGTNQYDSIAGALSFTNGDLLLTGSNHFLRVQGAASSSNASVFSFGGSGHDVNFNGTLGFSNGGTFTVPGTGCNIDVASTSSVTTTAFTLAGNTTNLTFGDSFTGTTGIWTVGGDDVISTFNGSSVLGTGDVNITGTDSKIIVDDNASLTLDYDIGQAGFESDFSATVTVKNNATLFYNRYNDSSTDELSLDSCYNGSVVEFDNLEADGVVSTQNIPSVSYYDLVIRGDNFDEVDKAVSFNGPVTVRNDFTYERSVDGVAISDPITFTGNPGVISYPNYHGSGTLQEIIIANGASISFGSLFNNAKYQDRFQHNNKLTIESGGTLSLSEDQTLRLTTASLFSHNGVLNVANDASLIIANGKTVSGTGLTNITRAQSNSPSASTFNHWSSPVSTANIGPGQTVSGTVNYSYSNGEDDNSDYNRITSSTNMDVGKGYSALGNLSSTFVANGPAELNYGDINYTATESEDGDSDDENYYLVGNPYASGLSVHDFLVANTHATIGQGEIKGTIYLFSQTNNFGNYSRTADNIAVNVTGISDLGPAASGNTTVANSNAYTIASGQGFFVIDASPNTPGIDINFTESMQNGINNSFKSGQSFKSNIKSRYWLTINNSTNYKSTLIGFMSDATLGFDNYYDAPKVPSDVQLDIWSYIKNDKYEIQGLPENILATQRIPLGVTVPASEMFELNIAATDGVDDEPITLLDAEEGLYHDLRTGAYSFFAKEKGKIVNRFYLLIQGAGQPVNVDELNAGINSNSCLKKISSTTVASALESGKAKRVEVYNLSGQMQFGWNKGAFSLKEFEAKEKTSIIKILLEDGKICTHKLIN